MPSCGVPTAGEDPILWAFSGSGVSICVLFGDADAFGVASTLPTPAPLFEAAIRASLAEAGQDTVTNRQWQHPRKKVNLSNESAHIKT